VTETNGKRTIELDVSDPSVVRWSDRPENAGAGDDPDDHDAEPESYPPTGGPGSRGYDRRTEPPADAPESGLPRRTPSPRPRMGVNEPMRDGVRKPAPPSEPEAVVGIDFGTEPPLETPYVIPPLDDPLLVSAALTDSMPTVPIRFYQARVVSPGVSAAPDSDDLLFDQAADGASVAEAYMAATPPPGTAPGTVGRIRSVAATLFVTDLSRSIIFYRDTLGFIEADAGRGSAVLVSGDAKIVLRRVGMAPVDRRLVQLLLEVPDVNAAYEDLRARSVPFIHRPRKVGQYEQQTLWAAALRDPDGHGIAITQWRHA
jgi:catechol 2,3-dioxygenase-like lactoylglutathione lyase family enzyme